MTWPVVRSRHGACEPWTLVSVLEANLRSTMGSATNLVCHKWMCSVRHWLNCHFGMVSAWFESLLHAKRCGSVC